MTGSAGRYSVSFYASGVLVDSGQIDWDGTAEITGVSTSTQIGTRAATSDSRFAFLDASIAARPTNPLLTSDVRLNNIDVATSTRMATFTYTAPDNTSVTAIKAKTDQLVFTGANLNANAQVISDKTGYNVSSINAAVINSTVAPNLDVASSTLATTSALSAVATTANTVEASLTTITAALPTAGAKIAGEGATIKNLEQLPTVAAIVAGVFNNVVENSKTFVQIMRINLAVLTGRTTGVGTSTNVFKSHDNTKARVTTTFDSFKNRADVTLDGD
jgi:hypothetical protein